jgi:mono/diheme cytochrome c family protein
MKKIVFILAISMICSFSYPALALPGGKELFEKKCDGCHSLQRPLSKKKDLDAWMRTTARMSKHSSGMIKPQEADEIAQYLAARTGDGDVPAYKDKGEEDIKKVVKLEDNEMFNFKKVRINQFIEPEVCEGCHSDIYEMWDGSMHSRAFVDPLWRAATKLFVKDAKKPGEILEMKACVKCHTPLGFRSYSITSPESDYEKVPELAARGIFCNWCHNISQVKHIGDAGYEIEPGGGEEDPSTMLGPFKDSDSDFHPTRYSELHTRSEFCGLCHNVSHAANRLPIETTYDEWKNSPYNTGDPATAVNCQDCHMRQRPGVPATGKTERPDNPGKACDDGPDREHIWTHYFVGGNAIVTKLMGSDVHAKMAVERLQNAADLEVIKSSSYSSKGLSYIKVKVINSGAGHYLPTGLTEVRQMWLDVMITDAKGKILLRSGELDKSGAIDENAIQFHTVLGNEKGEPVLNVAKADRVLYDYRVPPKGYVIESYAFFIHENAESPLRVEVKLNYRSSSQALARTLLGEDAPEIPVINMARVVDKIEF